MARILTPAEREAVKQKERAYLETKGIRYIQKPESELSHEVQAARQQSQIAAGIRERASARGVSPEVQATQERAGTAPQQLAPVTKQAVTTETTTKEGMTITSQVYPAQQLAPILAVDYATLTSQGLVGGMTIKGEEVKFTGGIQPTPPRVNIYGTGLGADIKKVYYAGKDVATSFISPYSMTQQTVPISKQDLPSFASAGLFMGYEFAKTTREKGMTLKSQQESQISEIENFNKWTTETFGTRTEITPEEYGQYQLRLSELAKHGIMGKPMTTLEGKPAIQLSSLQLETPSLPIYFQVQKKLGEEGKTFEKYVYGTGTLGAYAGTAYFAGKVTAPIIKGIAGGTEYIAGKTAMSLGGQYATGRSFVIGTGVALASVKTASDIYTTKIYAREAGLSELQGSLMGLGKTTTETYFFIQGVSSGQFPYKPVAYKSWSYGEERTSKQVYTLYGQAGQKATPYLTYVKGEGLSFGYPKDLQFTGLTTDLMASGYVPQSVIESKFYFKYFPTQANVYYSSVIEAQQTRMIIEKLRGVQIKETGQFDYTKWELWNKLPPAQQEVMVKGFEAEAKGTTGFKGFINTVTGQGLERYYGSSTISMEGGFEKNLYRPKGQFGDIDISFRGEGKPFAEKMVSSLTKAGGVKFRVSGVSLVEAQIGGKWVHAIDVHGLDNPDLLLGTPFGYPSQPTKYFYLTETQQAPAQQLGESLTQKGATISALRQTPKGLIITAPAEYRTKDIPDFVSVAEKLSSVSGKAGTEIMGLKTILKVNYPMIQFSKSIEFYGGLPSPSPVSLPPITILPSVPRQKVTPLISVSPTPYSTFSEYISHKPSKSPSPSVSKLSVSPSLSQVSSVLPSSPSIKIPSPSPSPSYFYSPSPSPSLYPSISPSPSPSPSPSYSYSPSPSPNIPSLLGFPTFPIGLLGETKSRKLPKGKRRGKYTPSYEALILNIKGKAPKSITGLEVRPITKGFSWAYGKMKLRGF